MAAAAHHELLRAALAEAGVTNELVNIEPLSGGCIHEVVRVTLTDGLRIVAKVNDESRASLFEEEAKGLEAIAATQTVLVPAPIAVVKVRGKAVLLMSAIEPARPTEESWMQFGEELAAFHQTKVGERYGFDIDNHLGTTAQPNRWTDDWVDFNAEHRLGHQVRLARDAAKLDKAELATIERVIGALDELIPRKPTPALLHGDLWSGNALPARGQDETARIAVIDPAPYVGDGWADIAMMRLFGGFPNACYERYSSCVADHDNVEQRIAVYQLYHMLNHVNIFGRGYAGQAVSIARTLQ